MKERVSSTRMRSVASRANAPTSQLGAQAPRYRAFHASCPAASRSRHGPGHWSAGQRGIGDLEQHCAFVMTERQAPWSVPEIVAVDERAMLHVDRRPCSAAPRM